MEERGFRFERMCVRMMHTLVGDLGQALVCKVIGELLPILSCGSEIDGRSGNQQETC